MNDKAIILLDQIFLECQDRFSQYRFAAFLSVKYSPKSYKFLMSKELVGSSGDSYMFDIAVYRREPPSLIALGSQNNSEKQLASDDKSIRTFVSAVKDICGIEKSLVTVYYSSSYGYDRSNSLQMKQWSKLNLGERDVDIKFLNYGNSVYYEVR